MNTITANADGRKRNYYFSLEEEQEDMATASQKRTLMDFIFQHIDVEKQESYLQQLGEISKTEASDWILEFTMGKWR
jgi:hypothetical protein